MKTPAKLGLVLFSMAISAIALAFADGKAESDPCQEGAAGHDHVTEIICLEHEVTLAACQLQETEAKVRKQILVWDKENVLTERTLELFERSVVAFNWYLSSACEVDAASTAGGNGAHDMNLLCQARLIKERVGYLQNQQSYFRN